MGSNERTRRQYLAALGALGVTGLAGCGSGTPTEQGDRTRGERSQATSARTQSGTPPKTRGENRNGASSGIREDTRKEYIEVAKQSATQVEQWRSARIKIARLYAQHDSVEDADTSETQTFLETEEEEEHLPDDIYQIHYVETNSWDVLASTSEYKQGAPLNTREAPWQEDDISYGEDGVFVSPAEEVHRRSIVSFVTPVDTDADRDIVLVAMSNFDDVAQDLPTTADRGFTNIVDEDGRVVGTTEADGTINRNDGTLTQYRYGEDAPMLQRGLDGELGVVEDPESADAEDESSYVAAFVPVPYLPWVAITHVPTEHVD